MKGLFRAPYHYLGGPELEGWRCAVDDRYFIAKILRHLPEEFRDGIRDRYNSMRETHGPREANLRLLALGELARKSSIALAADDAELCAKAESYSREYGRITAQCRAMGRSAQATLDAITPLILAKGILLPKGQSPESRLARAQCPYWWRRQLRRLHGRNVEALALAANLVHRYADPYVSRVAVSRRRTQKQRNLALLAALWAINDDGECLNLAEVVSHSQANPKNRRSELMCRMAGFEQIAGEMGYVGEFYTLTCPSRMHSALAATGERNPRYDGTTPDQAQKHLVKNWAKFRSALDRRGIKPFGMRVVEPQHDGTPHWHLLLFMAPEHVETVRALLRHYALSVDGDEPGADEHRFKAVAIDWSRGTATGYIAKYISKNIDGFGIAEDTLGHAAANAAERVGTCASIWRFRQFQQFGGPPVSAWREFRRMKADGTTGLVRQLIEAADRGDWATFVNLSGGPNIARKELPYKPFWKPVMKPNAYGEIGIRKLCGLEFTEQSLVIETREHEWDIVRLSSPPWSSVNNCTQPESSQGPRFSDLLNLMKPLALKDELVDRWTGEDSR